MSILSSAKRMGLNYNVTLRVIDQVSGDIVSEHIGHNNATNTLLTGIGHYLKGDGIWNQGYSMLSAYVPRYISLGTMGLINQSEDSLGLPAALGSVSYLDKTYADLSDEDLDILGKQPSNESISVEDDEHLRLVDYIYQRPGFGADGYDPNLNNGREAFGLGPTFANRAEAVEESRILQLGDINFDGVVDMQDLLILVDYDCGRLGRTLTPIEVAAADIDGDGVVGHSDISAIRDCIDGKITEAELGKREYSVISRPTVNCELISESFPRSLISFRDIIPEVESEIPRTIDVVLSAMISTGALSQFRESDRDYIFITEAGLWSDSEWNDSGENGLLAAYRLAPTDSDSWILIPSGVDDSSAIQYLRDRGIADVTPKLIEDAKRSIVKQNIDTMKRSVIKVKRNQVVQVIWKLQLGSVDQFGGVDTLYPGKAKKFWIELPTQRQQ